MINWREKGAVTPVKDQGNCGSCWAFSATGGLEGQHFRKTGELVHLSEQNLVDCSAENDGCNGGLMHKAYQYVMNNKGINTEETYPYEGLDNECRYNATVVGSTVTSFEILPSDDEESLKDALANIGPVTVGVDSSLSSFHEYSEGVYDDPKCGSKEIGHAMLVVGYDTDAEGGDYWLVKNSWGATWGDQGYIKIARNKGNLCGIATYAVYPEV